MVKLRQSNGKVTAKLRQSYSKVMAKLQQSYGKEVESIGCDLSYLALFQTMKECSRWVPRKTALSSPVTRSYCLCGPDRPLQALGHREHSSGYRVIG